MIYDANNVWDTTALGYLSLFIRPNFWGLTLNITRKYISYISHVHRPHDRPIICWLDAAIMIVKLEVSKPKLDTETAPVKNDAPEVLGWVGRMVMACMALSWNLELHWTPRPHVFCTL